MVPNYRSQQLERIYLGRPAPMTLTPWSGC